MQVDIHAPWGGVVPSLASEAHKQAMEGVVQDALRQAGLRAQQLDAVAVTIGPGLSLCLKVRLPADMVYDCIEGFTAGEAETYLLGRFHFLRGEREGGAIVVSRLH